ncbi:MAG: T9SS type A sorting domain-containing protein [Ignavibacteria bacterium]|nr:T9SS type A sorting domain-containing protein [Ignavibacteria bacterium]
MKRMMIFWTMMSAWIAVSSAQPVRTSDSLWFSTNSTTGEPKLTTLTLSQGSSTDLYVWLKVASGATYDVGSFTTPISYSSPSEGKLRVGTSGAGKWIGNTGGPAGMPTDASYGVLSPFDSWTTRALYDSSYTALGDSAELFLGFALSVASGSGWTGRTPVAKFQLTGIDSGIFTLASMRHLLSDGARSSLLIANTAGTNSWRPVVVPLSVGVGITALSVAVEQNWNMVSVPLIVADYNKSAVFPTANSAAFSYNGSYMPQTLLANGTGYWVKFALAQSVGIGGQPIASDTFDVSTGWNMIGSLSGTVSTSTITTSPSGILRSSFFGYSNASGYTISSSIEAGRAYWIKVSQPGTLHLASATIFSQPTSGITSLGGLNELIVKDAVGRQRRLYFDSSPVPQIELYEEMPPQPPHGAFDVRFATGRFVERPNMNGIKSIPIRISDAVAPLSIRWSLRNTEGVQASLVVDRGELPLEGSGSVVLQSIQSTVDLRLSLKDESQLPREFDLAQNYPNPFNPTTMLMFDLPLPSKVSLRVYNTLGQVVRSLVENKVYEAGRFEEPFDASALTSGVYFYEIVARSTEASHTSYQNVRKMVLLR